MITIAIIAFREFLEAFLIVGVFLGISGKFHLNRDKEIWLAVFIGVILSLLLSTGVYILGDSVRGIFSEENTELIENCLMIFSGLFIAYIVFSLHNVLQKSRNNILMNAHQKLQQEAFNIALFITIVSLIFREGFEIALFSASVSLFSAFMQNFLGLMLGFLIAAIFGLATLYVYSKFPINKVFKATEYMIILVGASLTQLGVTELLEKFAHIDLSLMFSFYFQFLPEKDTLVGHLLQGFLGIDREFSLGRLIVMAIYISIIYLIFKNKRSVSEKI